MSAVFRSRGRIGGVVGASEWRGDDRDAGAGPGGGLRACDAVDRLEQRLDAAEVACDELQAAIDRRCFEGAVAWRRSVDATVQALAASAEAGDAQGRAARLLARASDLLAQAPAAAPDDASIIFAMGLPGIAESAGCAERRRRWLAQR